MKLGFIGGGNMAEAMLSAVLEARLFEPPLEPHLVTVYEPSPARRQILQQRYTGVRVVPKVGRDIEEEELIVLAVKPQDLQSALDGLKGRLSPSHLVLSVVAGAGIAAIQQGLGHQAVVRVMPNINARARAAVSAWTAASGVNAAQKELARQLLAALGREVEVAEEKYLDMATALSGSGPAYVFLFLEALTDAGVHIGLPRPLAQELALGTVAGSAKLVEATGLHPAELRSWVVSPGGTTAQALLRLEQGGFRGLVTAAVAAAYERAKGLGASS